MSATAGEIDQIKRELRARCIAARDSIPLDIRQDGARRLSQCDLGVAGVRPDAIVSAYAAMGSEIDPLQLITRRARGGAPTCLPVIQPLGSPLNFRSWAPGEPLVARTWGIREPTDTALIVAPDVVLVPLLAFDSRGWRLGYGGGYYDRTLEQLRSTKPILAIGLAYDSQELPEVPTGPHDQLLDWVLTPTGLRRLG